MCYPVRLILIFALFVLVLTTSCSKSATGPETTDRTPTGSFVKSDLARDADPQASDADVSSVVSGNTDFMLKAFPLLDANPGKNIVFSPYSITLAVAQAAAGAKGTTLSGIETALSFTLAQVRLNPAFNKLDLLLASKTTGTVNENGEQAPRLSSVNALWGQDGFPLLPSYLDTLAVNYGAGLHLVDFIREMEKSRQMINAWVEKETNSRIKDLMPQGSVTNDTRLVLTNAIWFKSNWASRFPVGNTKPRIFTNRDNTQSAASFMTHTFGGMHAGNTDYQAVEIPYVDSQLSMLVVMPAPGAFDSFVSAQTPTAWDSTINSMTAQQVALSMPKFSFESSFDLQTVLKTLGMTQAFDPGSADFSGIDGARDLFIQAVVHKAFINVDENGTEAAAATGVGFGIVSIPPAPIVVTIDHPFIFMIRDRQTGLVLFMGKVVTL